MDRFKKPLNFVLQSREKVSRLCYAWFVILINQKKYSNSFYVNPNLKYFLFLAYFKREKIKIETFLLENFLFFCLSNENFQFTI